MTLTQFLLKTKEHGAAFYLDEEGSVRARSGDKLPEELLSTARTNRELIKKYLTLTASAFILGRWIDESPENGYKLPEFMDLARQIAEIERTVITSPQEAMK